MDRKKITLQVLKQMKTEGQKIACLTAYDYSFAVHLDDAGIDIILVGDSLGMVLHGEDTTLKVTMADMIYHTRIVKNGCKHSFLITDMPFMSYSSPAKALGNAARLIAEGGAEMVKLEGGSKIAEVVNTVTSNGIPVCAHLGLTPQSVHKLGGYQVQGRHKDAARQIKDDARILEQAGADLLVLECIPLSLAEEICKLVSMPVIGIGAGIACDGQVLVLYDMLGLTTRQPKFSRNFMEQADSINHAIRQYVSAVKSGQFPEPRHTFD